MRLAWILITLTLITAGLVAGMLALGSPPAPSPASWTRVDPPGFGSLNGVVPASDGYLAVDGARVWTSFDCQTWSPIPSDESPRGRLASIASTDAGYVAVGSAAGLPAAWFSADGQRWARATLPPLPGGTTGLISDVAAAGGQLVAVGSTYSDADWNHAAIWTSSGGLTWEVARRFDDGTIDAYIGGIRDVQAAGPGFIAVGLVTLDPGHAWAWSSTDGLDWMRVDVDGLASVAVGPSSVVGFVNRRPAVGDRGWAPAGFAWSPDGVAWNLVHAPGLFDIEVELTSPADRTDTWVDVAGIVATDAGFLAVGNQLYERTVAADGEDGPHFGGTDGARMWSSADGRSWTRVALDPVFAGASLSGLYACGDTLLASGDLPDGQHGLWALPGRAGARR